MSILDNEEIGKPMNTLTIHVMPKNYYEILIRWLNWINNKLVSKNLSKKSHSNIITNSISKIRKY